MAVITMRQMLEAGAHFGHQTRRWNPKMKRFIWGERNGIYIIDLEQTLGRVETAYGYVRDLVAGGGTILFVGTKKQAQDPVRSYADKCGMPYVNERWLGGMLTNFETMSKRVGKMLEYERMQASGEFEAMIKKEALMLDRELTKLQRNLGGLRGMTKAPDAIFVLDTKKEHIAVTEANKLGIPVVAVVDTNVDPEVVQYPIPGNDDAIRSNSLFARVIADAVEEGRFIANKRNPAPPPPVERTAEEVAEFEASQAAARSAAAQAQADRDARLAAAKEQSLVAEEDALVNEIVADEAVAEELVEAAAVDAVIVEELIEEAVVADAIVEELIEEAEAVEEAAEELAAEGRFEEAAAAEAVAEELIEEAVVAELVEEEILEELAEAVAVEEVIEEALLEVEIDEVLAEAELDVVESEIDDENKGA
jgi:small subunit ribosomal protein S2